MAKLPDLFVNAVATWDGKALSKGQKQIGGFDKSVKKLAKVFAGTFGVTAIAAFGKASVKAFAEDEKAATKLTRTVNNLGLGFENARITKFISDLEKTAAVSDDVLRPAFTSLLTTTGSVEKSQKLLALALDISAGSGENATTVANDLANAYVGNTKGLTKYRLGLTKAELAGKSFSEIQDLLNKQFSGQNADRLDTYAGKMEALAVASDNAKEIIGKGLVDALSMLGENDSVSNLADDMESVALYIGDAIRGVGVLVEYLKSIPGAGILFDAFKLGFKSTPLGLLNELGRANRVAPKPFSTPMTVSGATDSGAKDAKARAAAEAAAAKRQKELLALQKKSAIAEKNKLSLSKAAAVFDTNRISIAAALQATYDKETRLRLEALMAIEEDQGDLALKKINELAALQKNADLAKLAGITTIGDAALQELNNRLLAELKVINTSMMAEDQKELAREEAFKKYNAALVAAGGLAEKNSYDERVQIQLTEIAKLAALSNTLNAGLTLNKIRESEEITTIDKIAKAQKAADDARMKALLDYIEALKKLGGGGPTGPTQPPKEPKIDLLKDIKKDFIKPIDTKGGSIGAILEYADAATERANAFASLLEDQNKLDQLALDDYMKQLGLVKPTVINTFGTMPTPSPGEIQSGNRYAAQARNYYVTINAGAIASQDEFAGLVQQTIQDLNRGGDPLSTAGSL